CRSGLHPTWYLRQIVISPSCDSQLANPLGKGIETGLDPGDRTPQKCRLIGNSPMVKGGDIARIVAVTTVTMRRFTAPPEVRRWPALYTGVGREFFIAVRLLDVQ